MGRIAKRVLDIAVALFGLIIASPLILGCALAIWLDMGRPVLFAQKRPGKDAKIFTVYKFRSMADALDKQGRPLPDGDRLTRLGAFLRKTSLDELPQLWNVLKGDMSLVGPRPPIPSEVASYHGGTGRRLSMRPGITCLWQISGRNEISFDEWVKLDLLYIDSWSLGLDLSILARTPVAVFQRRGAS
jgi:lipopolysaccharide/colanic/teichoic acid biosynthesis glycosyltransferase